MKTSRKCFLAAALAGLVAGCISYHTPPMDRRVTVAPNLGTAVWVTDVRLAKGPSSHFTMQANDGQRDSVRRLHVAADLRGPARGGAAAGDGALTGRG